jgi:hypothetical protein
MSKNKKNEAVATEVVAAEVAVVAPVAAEVAVAAEPKINRSAIVRETMEKFPELYERYGKMAMAHIVRAIKSVQPIQIPQPKMDFPQLSSYNKDLARQRLAKQ